MGLLVVVLSVLLLSGLCSGEPAALTPGTCWVMGNLHNTFDNQYYTFMGNCTYTLAKNCNGATLPSFEVDTDYMNAGDGGAPSVGAVAVNVHGFHIEIVRSAFGVVRVNYQEWSLPISLNNGMVKLYQKGLFVVVEADFGLMVQYDWSEYLAITVPGSFSGNVCGLCGNFNNKNEDDLTTPSGSVASSVEALGASWRVPSATDDAFCRDGCGGQCPNCPLSEVQKLEYQILCETLTQDIPEYAGCQPDGVNATVFQSNCMSDLCSGEDYNTFLCNTIQGYAEFCQMSGFKGSNWRTTTQCSVPVCPTNSHYEFCGTSCPATCADPNPPTECTSPCVEACVCNDGFLLSGTECVPQAQCGCMYEGHYVGAGGSFWGDDTCTKRYTCAAGGRLSLTQTSCPAGQQCQAVGGIRGCYPVSRATCMVSGDPHFVTFDGERYNFQGTCAYELAGVSANAKGLETFSVVLQNSGQDKKIGSSLGLVEVKVKGYTVVISKEYAGAVLVNGELSNLPVTLDNSTLRLYRSGWFAVLETDAGVKVYYDWGSAAFVTVPSTYMGATQGLCGNYNLNPKDDMQMRNGEQAATPEALGRSWQVGTVPGCVDGCSGPCPGCNSTQKALYSTNSVCGLVTDPAGPFRDCHAKVEPTGFLGDCLYDVCLYGGKGNMQCKTLTAYTAACQLAGARVYPWRSAQLCDAQCPPNSHYELCTSSCVGSCVSDCGAPCMEGCACSEGYLLSGGGCVPANQCGCMSEGKYYQQGEVFYPDAQCQKQCTCNGTVQCTPSSCGPYDKCETKDYVRSCQSLGRGVCSISGDPHYHTFDNGTYDFQGTCTYVAAETCRQSSTRLTDFSVAVENEKWYLMSDNPQVSVAKLVAVEVYGNILILRRNEVNMVWVNGIVQHLPLNLLNGAVKVYQEGTNDVILTDFGLRVTYDLVYHVTITVPGAYRGQTCGLCGNFNGDPADELQLPDGNVTRELQTFGAAWKVPVPGVVCDDGCSGDACPTCDASKKAAIEEKCAIIISADGPFAACHNVIEPASYYRDCVYDVCLAKDEQSVLCHSVSAYMLDCQDFGASVLTWRSPSFCPFKCNANSHYEACALPCAASCPGLLDVMTCTTACVEGCVCDSNYSYNGTGCVPTEQCSCYYKGQTLQVGQSIMTDDCHSIHTCQASGVVLSKSMSCEPNEHCQVKDGQMACYLQQCTVGRNATVTAFNGENGAVTAPGAYEIIQNCDPSAASNWFRVVVKFDTCAPGVNSFMAMYVFFTGVMIVVNNKHDVWVNGKAMTQNDFSGNNVRVVLSDGAVTITNPSSLQLTFSSADQLVVSVSDEAADVVCGACGKLQPVDTSLRALRQSLLASLQGSGTVFASLNIGQWTAPDFPECGS